MIDIYTTAQGDTFDSIAFWLYGDEKYMKELIEANWDKADTLVFDSGVQLIAPDVYEDEDEDLPFWREEDSEDSEDEDSDSYFEYSEESDEDLTDAESEEESPDSEEDEDDE